jgi:F-box and WD-40 domain protein CDC4
MDTTVRIWDLKDGTCKHILTRHQSLVGVLSLSPSFLISGAADGLLCIWDPGTGDLVHAFEQNYVVTAIEHDDNKALSGSDGLVRVHDIKSGKVRDLWNEKRGWVVSRLAFGGSLCVVATRDNKSFIDVWDFGDHEIDV